MSIRTVQLELKLLVKVEVKLDVNNQIIDTHCVTTCVDAKSDAGSVGLDVPLKFNVSVERDVTVQPAPPPLQEVQEEGEAEEKAIVYRGKSAPLYDDVDREPILQDPPNRFVYESNPEYEWANQWYKKQVAAFWTAEEVDLDVDEKQFSKLPLEEQDFLIVVLSFFAASDGIVGENLITNFMTAIKIPQIRAAYNIQNFMEQIHGETYALLLETLVKDKARLRRAIEAMLRIPCVKAKAKWALDKIENERSFPAALVAFAAVEGIFFSGSFASVFWFKSQNKLPGVCFSNEKIIVDEGMHTDFACDVYKRAIVNKLTLEQVHGIIDSAMKVEIDYCRYVLPHPIKGLTSDKLIGWSQVCADSLCRNLGYAPIYTLRLQRKIDYPVYMDLILLEGKTNFFEKRVGEYQKAGVGAGSGSKKYTEKEKF